MPLAVEEEKPPERGSPDYAGLPERLLTEHRLDRGKRCDVAFDPRKGGIGILPVDEGARLVGKAPGRVRRRWSFPRPR